MVRWWMSPPPSIHGGYNIVPPGPKHGVASWRAGLQPVEQQPRDGESGGDGHQPWTDCHGWRHGIPGATSRATKMMETASMLMVREAKNGIHDRTKGRHRTFC